tara:strand:- start:241 stop:576 length:336 start_codon:yes stop_codon:yes gene_type:complete
MKQIQLLLIPILILILIDYQNRDSVSYEEIESLRYKVKYLNSDNIFLVKQLNHILKTNNLEGLLDTIIEIDPIRKQYYDERWYINTGMLGQDMEVIYEHSDEVKDMLQQMR